MYNNNNNTMLPQLLPCDSFSLSLSLTLSLCVSCNMPAPTRSSDAGHSSDNSNWKRPLDTQANAMASADSIVVSLPQWGNTCCACSRALSLSQLTHSCAQLCCALLFFRFAALCFFLLLLLLLLLWLLIFSWLKCHLHLDAVAVAAAVGCAAPHTHTHTQTRQYCLSLSLSARKKYSLCFS